MSEYQEGVIVGTLASGVHTLRGRMCSASGVLHGRMCSASGVLHGRMCSASGVLRGRMRSASGVLRGRMCSTQATLIGHMQSPSDVFIPYTGPYEVTPSASAQVLCTAEKVMVQDLVINPIPSNYGLITYNGFELTVS